MNAHKKLEGNISELIQDKLDETAVRPEMLKKLIKKMAKKLAEKVVRISVKQDKKLKKGKQSPQPVVQAEIRKNKIENRAQGRG